MKIKLFSTLESYLYTALASVVMVYASKHPVLHDPALWLLGVIGHAIGASGAGSSGGSAAPAAEAGSGSVTAS